VIYEKKQQNRCTDTRAQNANVHQLRQNDESNDISYIQRNSVCVSVIYDYTDIRTNCPEVRKHWNEMVAADVTCVIGF